MRRSFAQHRVSYAPNTESLTVSRVRAGPTLPALDAQRIGESGRRDNAIGEQHVARAGGRATDGLPGAALKFAGQKSRGVTKARACGRRLLHVCDPVGVHVQRA